MTDHDAATEGRLARLEETTARLDEDLHDFRAEVRAAFDGVNSRLIGFAFTVAASGIGIALTVLFTR